MEMQWGLREAVPANAVAAWGARLIVTQDGHVDLVPDRVDVVGSNPGRVRLLRKLNARFPFPALSAKLAALLRDGEVDTREQRQFTLFSDHFSGLRVEADCAGSGGYCYVAAWLEPGAPEDNA